MSPSSAFLSHVAPRRSFADDGADANKLQSRSSAHGAGHRDASELQGYALSLDIDIAFILQGLQVGFDPARKTQKSSG